MDLGSEITGRLKGSIKTKLQELGSYIDDELPEYIMVMISNKRSPDQMKEDLSLFLGDETERFVSWVFIVLRKLQDATDITDAVFDIPIAQAIPKDDGSKEAKEEKQSKQEEQLAVNVGEKPKRKLSNSDKEKAKHEKDRKRTSSEIQTTETIGKVGKFEEEDKKLVSNRDNEKKKEKKDKEEKIRSQLAQKGPTSDNEIEDNDSKKSKVLSSKVEVQKRVTRPSLPISRQASGILIKRAMEEARKSVVKPGLVTSHEYDINDRDSDVWISDPELREQQKQVLLKQHKELEELRSIKNQLKIQKAIIDQVHSPTALGDGQNVSLNGADSDNEEKDGIELEVNENEFSDEWIEVDTKPKDRRVIDVTDETQEDTRMRDIDSFETENDTKSGDKDADGIHHENEMKPVMSSSDGKGKETGKERHTRREIKDLSSRNSRDRRRRHSRHREHRERRHASDLGQVGSGIGADLLSPKFVVTLNGVDSDYEKKFEDEHRRERRRKRFIEKDLVNKNDTLFINLDKRTSNLKPLEIMQQALLTIQQPLLQGQQPSLPPSTELITPQIPILRNQPELYPPFAPHNQLIQPPKIFAPDPSAAAVMNVTQPQVPQVLPNAKGVLNSTRNLTNLVPLAYATAQRELTESTNDENVVFMKENNRDSPSAPSVEKVRIRLDSESGEEGEQEMETDTVLERCKFWPECKNGVACAYIHPTVPCKSFPSCTYLDKCIFLHPICKFDGRCSNVSCPYTHTSKQKMFGGLMTAPSVQEKSVPLCHFYPNCSKKFCPFRHPVGKPCRYGSACTRSDCRFAHETKPAERAALKWTSTSKESKTHVSERQFAVAETDVVPSAVSVST